MMNETLTYLDLSNCNSIGDGQAFTSLKNLKVLILYNCPLSPAALRKIAQLKTLRSVLNALFQSEKINLPLRLRQDYKLSQDYTCHHNLQILSRVYLL